MRFCSRPLNLLVLLTALIAGGTAVAQDRFSWPSPGPDQRPWVRWWWLGNAVDSAGIHDQLSALHAAGIGGVEITPIYGAKGWESRFIDYLSPRWMRMLAYAETESQRLGMKVDMATGTGWPFGGPQISAEAAAGAVQLRRYDMEGGKPFTDTIRPSGPRAGQATLECLMAYGPHGQRRVLTRRVTKEKILRWMPPEGRWTLWALFAGHTFQRVKRASPGGEGLVMDHFSKAALHRYLAPFDSAFSRGPAKPPHAFFNDSYEVYGADWTPGLLDAFGSRRGYRLEDYLDALAGLGDADTVRRVIADYRQTVAEMLLEHFTRPWTAWAHGHGSLTRNQAHGSPGNLLDLYGAVDIPEIESYGSSHFDIPGLPEDSLGERPGKLDPLLLKFASSAAHVMGKPMASSETFTWLGEHFRVSLAQCKPVLDEMLLAGINHVLFHGTPYSPRGAAWPGWQFYASMNFTPYNSWWTEMPAFDEYIARAQSFLQAGQPDNDLLVYWPLQDIWAKKGPGRLYPLSINNADEWLGRSAFHRTCEALMTAGYGIDYISDAQLDLAASSGRDIRVPGGDYKALVIPPCDHMPDSTLQRILALARGGATVVFLEHLPGDVPGLRDLSQRRRLRDRQLSLIAAERVFRLNRSRPLGQGRLLTGPGLTELMALTGIPAEGFPEAGLRFIRRRNGQEKIYFIANLQAGWVDHWVKLAGTPASAVLYDPATGHIGEARLAREKDSCGLYLQLAPGQSLIVRTFPEELPPGHAWSYMRASGEPRTLDGPWTLRFLKGAPMHRGTWTLDTLRTWTGLGDSAAAFSGTATYRTTFAMPQAAADDWLLDLGVVDFSADVRINGHAVGQLWCLPFSVRIGPYLRPGQNILEVDVTNLGANRIADAERRGWNWKFFYDINVVNMQYRPLETAAWAPVPSGLLGPVRLIPLSRLDP